MYIVTNKAAQEFQAIKAGDVRRLIVSRHEDGCTVDAIIEDGNHRRETLTLGKYENNPRAESVLIEVLEIISKPRTITAIFSGEDETPIYHMPKI